MRASVEIPAGPEVARFHKMLLRAGRGRIRLSVQVRHGGSVAAIFDGVFAAAVRRGETEVSGKLILVRHGQSIWNLENLYTGWHDVDLSDQGRLEAAQAGRELLAKKLSRKLPLRRF